MKVLLVNSHHTNSGGAEKYYFDLGKLLQSRGSQVAYFSMHEAGNHPTPWKKYFVDNINFNKGGFLERVRQMSKVFYSFEAKKKMAKILDDFKPDIVHINNIYLYISPSILSEIKKRSVPIIQTVHDYGLISPNVTMFHDGKICETYQKQGFFAALVHKCVAGSFLATLVSLIALKVGQIFDLYRYIDLFICPSLFMKTKLVESGVSSSKVVHLPNFSLPSKHSGLQMSGRSKYVLYCGRLTEAKGVYDLVKLAGEMPTVNFFIAGGFDTDLEKTKLESLVGDNKLGNIRMLGFVNTKKLTDLIAGSEFVIVPSRWYENQPYSILEAFFLAKPVVASNIGGIPEIVKDGKTGLHFEPGNGQDLKRKVRYLWTNKKVCNKMGKLAKKYAYENFSHLRYLREITAIYAKFKTP